MISQDPAAAPLREQVRAKRQWYHTMELAPGLVTPGWFDLREVPGPAGLPARLDGLRCLDVGTFDGFWAFEMERRGAREVVAVDIVDPLAWDWPVGAGPDVVEALEERKEGGHGFAIAREAYGSAVRYLERSVYELDPVDVGRFDLIYMGSLLLHLRDPVLALERLRGVCDGHVLTVDAIDAALSRLAPRWPLASFDGQGRPWWWLPNVAAYVRLVRAAGLEPERVAPRVRLPAGPGHPRPRPSRRLLVQREARRTFAAARWGDPHASILSRPR